MADYLLLRAELDKPTYSGLSDAAAATAIRAATATRLVLPDMSLTDLATSGGFAPASVAAVFVHVRFTDFRDVVNKQDRPGAVAMATLLHAVGTITADDLDAFTAYATTPVEVPCSPGDLIGWPDCTEHDVAHARSL